MLKFVILSTIINISGDIQPNAELDMVFYNYEECESIAETMDYIDEDGNMVSHYCEVKDW